MSFTLMRYKDGAPAPIKLSIWDALKGAPPPRPVKPQAVSQNIEYAIPVIPVLSATDSKDIVNAANLLVPITPAEQPPIHTNPSQSGDPVECICCHKVHNPKPTDKSEKKDGNQNNTHSTSDPDTYSKADNKTIIEMKKADAGVSWDKILTEIGKKSKTQIKEHWKKINPDTADGKDKDDPKDNSNDDKPSNTRSTNDEETYSKADNKKILAMKKDDPAISWAKVLEAINKKSKSQIKEHWRRIDPDNKDDKSNSTEPKPDKAKDSNKKGNGKDSDRTEAGELKSWSDRYDKQKWIAAASRHFDLTGQRITPVIAKRLAEGK